MTLFFYVLRTLATRTAAALVVIATLYLVLDVIEAWRIIEHAGGGVVMLLNYVGDRSATALWHVLPAALLVGTMLGFGALAHRGELIAMGTAGLTPARLFAPALVLAFACSGAAFAIADGWLPGANRGIDAIYRAALAGDGASHTKRTDRWVRTGRHFVHFQAPDVDVGAVRAVTLVEVDDKLGVVGRIDADRMAWRDGGWEVSGATVRAFVPPRPTARVAALRVPVSAPPERLRSDLARPQQLTSSALAALIAWKRAEKLDAAPFEVALAERRSWPLLPLLFVLVATPLAARPRRASGATASLARAIGVAALFALAVFAAQSLGKAGVLAPALQAWLPVALLAAAGAVLSLRALLRGS